MSPFYLIYHPKRTKTQTKDLAIYHDEFGGNEDPYLWNKKFLHTFCHITQLSNNIGQVNFWISGNTSLNNFTKLFCDCVFHIEEKVFWSDSNNIKLNDPIVDNKQTFEHHYKWANPEYNNHNFVKRKRYTLKANPDSSFQPQDGKGNLVNVLPFLNKYGLDTEFLIESFKAGVGSKPYKLDDEIGQKLYKHLIKVPKVKLFGKDLVKKHPHSFSNISKTNKCC